MRGVKTPLDNVKRIVVVVVNSLSVPKTNWDQSERPPGTFEILIKATGVPIDRYSFETVELMRDMIARWDLCGESAIRPRSTPQGSVAGATSWAPRRGSTRSTCRSRSSRTRPNSRTSTTCRRRSCCRPRRSTACAQRPARSSLESPDFQRLLKDVGATPSCRRRTSASLSFSPLRRNVRRAGRTRAASVECLLGRGEPAKPAVADHERDGARARRPARPARASSTAPAMHQPADGEPLRREEDGVDAVHFLRARKRALRGRRRTTQACPHACEAPRIPRPRVRDARLRRHAPSSAVNASRSSLTCSRLKSSSPVGERSRIACAMAPSSARASSHMAARASRGSRLPAHLDGGIVFATQAARGTRARRHVPPTPCARPSRTSGNSRSPWQAGPRSVRATPRHRHRRAARRAARR